MRIAALSEQIEERPENAELHLARGELYTEHGEWASAEADYVRAAQLGAERSDVELHLASLFFASERPESAEAELKRLIAREPSRAAARLLYGKVLKELGRTSEAVREYDAAIDLAQASTPEIYLERAKVLAGAGDARLSEALEGLDAGIQALGPIVTLELFAIELERRRNRTDAALARIDQIAAQAPRQEKWLALRGEVLLESGRSVEAHDVFLRALQALRSSSAHWRGTPAAKQLETRIRRGLRRSEPSRP